MTDLNSVTNQLLNEFSKKFNHNYNDIVQLNSTIQNKEELIFQTQEVILYKERNIIILKYLLFYSIIVFVLTFLNVTKNLPYNQFISLLVVLFIVMAIACYATITNYFSLYNVNKKLQGLKVAMASYGQKLLENAVSPYECPSQCKNKDDSSDEETPSNFNYKNENGVLKIDPSLNVWKYGDVPVGMSLEEMSEIEPEDSPKPFFGNSYPRNTYYECQWLGNKSKENMPKDMREYTSKYSSIPCNYKPNNTEKARWFCEKDPNTLNEEEMQQFCQKNN